MFAFRKEKEGATDKRGAEKCVLGGCGEVKLDEKPGETAGEKHGEKAGETAGEKAGETAGEKAGERGGDETGEKIGRWIVFNRGTELEFAECSECGYEDDNNVFAVLGEGIRMAQGSCRCPKCGALVLDFEDAMEE